MHRCVFASKTFPKNLRQVLSDSAKIINVIKARTLNYRIFKKLFRREIGGEYQVFLYHTKIRWLSRGQVLKRLFELRKEVSVFLKNKNNKYSNLFDSEECIFASAYLANIFPRLIEINLSI